MTVKGRKARILAIAPYADMKKRLDVIAELRKDEVELTTCVGDLDEGLKLAREMMEHQTFDVVLSRGGTGELLRQQLDLPVASIPFSISDMLRDIKMFDNYVGKLAVVGVSNVTDNARLVCDILQKDIQIVRIERPEDTDEVIHRLKEEGVSLLIGDRISYQAAQREGLNAIFSMAGMETIQAGIDEAIRFIRANEAIGRQNELLKAALMHDDDAVILYASDGQILFSSLSKEKDGDQLLKALGRIPRVLAPTGDQEFLKKFQGKIYSIKKKEFFHGNDRHILLRISGKAHAFYTKEYITVCQEWDETDGEEELNSANLMGETFEFIKKYAPSPFPILIMGEAGTGRDKTARLLYRSSAYRKKPFYIVDCSAMRSSEWEQLLMAEDSPFAFIDTAIHLKALDALSIDDIRLFYQYIQTTRFLKRNRVTISLTLGSEHEAEIRAELLNKHRCVALVLPSLRDRLEELPNILALYTNQQNRLQGKQIVGFTQKALQIMQVYPWPRNLDQLHWVMREIALLTDGAYITEATVRSVLEKEEDLHKGEHPSLWGNELPARNLTLEQMTYEIVCATLDEERGNKEKTAARLGIGRTTLWRILRDHAK